MTSRSASPAPTAWRRTAWVAVVVLMLHAVALLGLPLRPPVLPGPDRQVTEARLIAPPPPPPAPVTRPPPPPPAPAAAPAARPARRAAAPPPPPSPPKRTPAPAGPDVVQVYPAAAEPASTPAGPNDGQSAEPARELAGGPTVSHASGSGVEVADPAPAAGQSQVHPSVQLRFDMLGQRGVQPWKGVFGHLDWQQDGQRYEARLAIKVLFKTVRTQTSAGRIVDGALVPERFTETRRNEEVAQLQRDQGRVVFGNGAPAAVLQPGAQDRLSVVMQLGALLAGNEARHPPGSRLAIQTVGPKDAEVWTFEVGETETVSVPAGQYSARRLTRAPRRPDDYRLELWLAPELGYLPVRMQQTQTNGDVIDLQLRDASTP
ncbi:DUF3108 domain-containing protein [Variovorax sp.]|uniref:DUF3108 domain-containing protein n=1 Tax=Variovorax sp. TaxID=1871043 RepID=UPI002D53FBD6|nr:DUF3108 domain-containing protein [Variovorax sp.]HYP81858.1 DUF3108 domain-containing protein [Variovorax sp.]